MSSNKGDDDLMIVIFSIIILLVSISLSVLAGVFMDWSWLTGSKSSPSPSPSVNSPSPSPSPENCEVEWLDTLEWKPCDEDNCKEAKGSNYAMYHYRTGTVKQAAKHGGRECPDLRQYKMVQVDSASPSAPSTPLDGSSFASPPASSPPASSPPASSPPASSAPASSPPASSPPASSPPASSPPAFTYSVTINKKIRSGSSSILGTYTRTNLEDMKSICNSNPSCAGFDLGLGGPPGQLGHTISQNNDVEIAEGRLNYKLYIKEPVNE